LIERGAIVLVPRGAGDDAYADSILSALNWPSAQASFDFDGWWLDVAQAVRAQFRPSLTAEGGTAPDNAGRTPPPET
jgi:hypothetical protein